MIRLAGTPRFVNPLGESVVSRPAPFDLFVSVSFRFVAEEYNYLIDILLRLASYHHESTPASSLRLQCTRALHLGADHGPPPHQAPPSLHQRPQRS